MEEEALPSNTIQHEQVKLIYKPILNSTIAMLISGLLLAYFQRDVIDQHVVTTWLAFLSTLLILRVFLHFAFKFKNKKRPYTFWKNIYLLLSALIALAWGSAGVVLMPETSFEYQAATIIILIGISAGSIITLSALKPSIFIAFSLIVMTPLTITLLSSSTSLAISFGMMCILYLFFFFSAANHIHKTLLQNITLRIQSQKREAKIQKSEAFVLKTSQILEMIATGTPIKDIYNAIALLYESRHPGMRCSMLELKGDKLFHGGAPSLPNAYCNAVDGLKYGPEVGSCGSATYTGKRVLVEDITSDPKWKNLKGIALPYGMRCCWSEPIKNNEGQVLGAFAMYYDQAALPNDDQLKDLEAAARLAGIVMERQRHEEILVKLHSAFEYAYDAIIITSLDAEIEYVNPAFEKMTGYSSQEAVGQYVKILRSDKHPENFYKFLAEQDHSGKPWQGEITIKCKDGSFLDVERSVSPVLDDDGQVSFLVAIQRDLTEHKALEAQFQQAQKMDAIGTLVGGIAHDFNNILAGITGNLFLIQIQLEEYPAATRRLEHINQLSNRAADLIQQLLVFARKDHVVLDELNLSTLTQEAFSFLRSSIPENIEMNLNIADNDEILIKGDTTQIHQVLLNLVNNAYHALENCQQPTIQITLKKVHIDKAFVHNHPYFSVGQYAYLSVHDNGLGIPDELIKHLFEPFFTTKEVGKGTGLGLSMVFGAIKRHHGYIEVDSTEGKETSFHIYIPLLEKPAAHLSTNKISTIPDIGNNETILLVDDEPEIISMGKEVLETLGYRVLQASNGLEAIEIFSTNQGNINLILTDIVMPKLGGAEAIERIREIQPDIKVIFSTAYDKNTAITEKIITNGDTILSKPYHIDKLSQVINQKLHNSITE